MSPIRPPTLGDEEWAQFVREIEAIVEAANAGLVIRLRDLGLPEDLGPVIELAWPDRGAS